MNSNNFVLVDVSALAHRALHSTPDLRHPDNPEMPTGILYQIGKTVEQLQHIYSTWNVAFFFDSRQSRRKELCPEYKATREALRAAEPADMQQKRKDMYEQVNALPKLLKDMGCINIFGQTGYEADDLIASAIRNNPDKDFIVASRDQDLYQLLSPSVKLFDPQTKAEYTESDFWKEWEIQPTQWSSVKAWAGCASDNVIGLKGVGEKTAVKFLRGKLSQESAKYSLFSGNLAVYTKNIELVRLPLKGAMDVKLVVQDTPMKWGVLAEYIGAVTFGWEME